MPKLRGASILLISVELFAQSPSPVDMDKRYLMAAQTLEEIRRREDVGAMRCHAWELFRGVNRMLAPRFPIPLREVPVWLTWSTKEEIFSSHALSFFDGLQILDQFRVFAGPPPLAGLDPTIPASSQIPLSRVSMSPAAAARMRARTEVPGLPGVFVTPIHKETIVAADQRFNDAGIVGTARQIAPFPDDSIAIKTAWYLVSSPVWEANPIPVWHGPPAGADPKDRLTSNLWPDHIRIDPTHARNRCAQVETSCPNLKPTPKATPNPDLQAIPIDRFFYVPVCKCEQAKALRDASGITGLAGIYPGDYVVLMGMHLTTREIPDWVWATFWWSDHPNEGEFSRDRPPFFPSPWKNYVMDTTLDMVTPRGPKGQPKAIYNPWIEVTTMPHLVDALASNCMNCHRASAYPRIAFPEPGLLDPAGTALGDKTKLDFLWTIGDQFHGPSESQIAPSVPKPVRRQ